MRIVLEETKIMDWIAIYGEHVYFFVVVEYSFSNKRTSTGHMAICQDETSSSIDNKPRSLRGLGSYRAVRLVLRLLVTAMACESTYVQCQKQPLG